MPQFFLKTSPSCFYYSFRFKVEFRGGCLQMGDYEQGEAGAVLVNGVGDLFYTEFQRKEQGIDHFILSEQTASFQFQVSGANNFLSL